MTDRWFVEIRPFTEDEADAGFRRMEAHTERDAYRISRGANINLNHAEYYTRILPPSPLSSQTSAPVVQAAHNSGEGVPSVMPDYAGADTTSTVPSQDRP